MKFSINFFGKKSTTTMESDQQSDCPTMENLDTLTSTIHRSQSMPVCHHLLYNDLDILDQCHNISYNPVTNMSNTYLDQSYVDINSNITFKHRDSFEDTYVNSDTSNKFDVENDSCAIRRISYDRTDSFPCDDSGFSSCGCLSDEKEDDSLKSHDCSWDCEDKHHECSYHRRFSLSLIKRSRSYSADSASSDNSDSSKLNSKLSSSLPPSHADDDHTLSFLEQSEFESLPSIGVSRRGGPKLRRRKIPSKLRIAPQGLNDGETDNDLNNNQASTDDLHSRLQVAPFQFATAFQNHGLLSFVGCICYTLFLMFFLGFMAFIWQIFKQFVSNKELKELRCKVLESRHKRDMSRTSVQR